MKATVLGRRSVTADVRRRRENTRMPLDARTAKRIDRLFHNTKQMPTVAVMGLIIPIALLIGGPLGLLYWVWRRALLADVDAGHLPFDPVPPPISGSNRTISLSPAEKIAFICARPHALLMPLYFLIFFSGLMLALILLKSQSS